YSYLMWGKYFNKTSIVAERDHELIGFITGFLQPNTPNTLFIWQIAVDSTHRGKGLASALIKNLLHQLKDHDVRLLEATVTPSNIPSSNLFKSIATSSEANCEISKCFLSEQFPESSHEDELTYRIGPLQICGKIIWRYVNLMTTVSDYPKVDMNAFESHESEARSYSRSSAAVCPKAPRS